MWHLEDKPTENVVKSVTNLGYLYTPTKGVATELTTKQRPDQFSRDPYLQLEKYYTSIGDENEAKKTYFAGRCAVRENAKDKGGRTQWPGLTLWWSDWWLKWLTGYGVQTARLLIPIITVFVLGLMVFLPSDALEVAKANAPAVSSKSSEKRAYSGNLATLTPTNKEKSLEGEKPELFDRVAYDLDLLLPGLNLGSTEKWDPQGHWREIYIVFHSMIGWLLIPLMVASLAGVIKRQ